MSNVIDDRVVHMKFDNEGFESNVQDTMKSLDDLDKNLKNLDKGSYGESLGNALHGIGDAVDNLSSKFDAWGIVGMEVIRRVTDFAIERGAEMVAALSTDNIIDGWNKYESVNSSIYAIMNQITDGTTYEEVVRAVEKLAWYSDATSFSLSDMVVALKGFMQQGMSLEESVPIIMGIGNSAMYAGANAKDASGAFLIWAKAASNNLSLRQWQQLSNTFGVTTFQFKQMAIDAAVTAGTLTDLGNGLYQTADGMEVTMATFDETLGAREGKWFTKDVQRELFGATSMFGGYIDGLAEYIKLHKEATGETLLWEEAVEKYNEEVLGGVLSDQDAFGLKAAESATVAKTLAEAIDAVKDATSTAWMDIFAGMFGLVNEAKNYWTDFSSYLNEIFAGPVQTIANYSKAWGELSYELGGRASFIQMFRNLAAAAESVAAPIKRAYKAIFGVKEFKSIVTQIGEAVKKMELFAESLILGEEASAKFQKVWEVIFEISKTVGTALSKIWGLFKAAGTVISPVVGLFGDLAYGLVEVLGVFFKVFNMEGYLWEWLKKPTVALKQLGVTVSDIVSVFKISQGPVIEGVASSFNSIGEAAGNLVNDLGTAGTSLTELYEEFKKTEAFTTFENNLKILYEDVKKSNDVFLEEFRTAYSESGGGIVGVIKGSYSGVKAVIANVYDSLSSMLDEHFGGAFTKIKAFASSVEETVSKAASSIKNLASSAFSAISGSIFGENGANELSQAQASLAGQTNSISKLRANIDKEMSAVSTAGNVMKGAVLGGNFIAMGSILLNIERMLKNISNVFKNAGNFINTAGESLTVLTNHLKSMQLEIKVDMVKSIALAVLELAAAMVVLSMIDPARLGAAGLAMTTLIGELALVMKIFSGNQGLGTRVGIASSFSTKSLGIETNSLSSMTTGLIKFAAALLVMAEAMKVIADIPEEKFKQGLAGITILLLELGTFAAFTDGTKGGLTSGVGGSVFKMASGLILMAQAISMLAELDNESNSLGKGVGAIGLIMAMLVAFEMGMNSLTGSKSLTDMGPLIGLSAGLASLALVIQAFALIPTDNLIKGYIAILGCLAAVLFFFKDLSAMQVDEKQILGISAAFVVLSVGMLALSAAMLAFNLVQPAAIVEVAVSLAILIGAVALIDKLNLSGEMMAFGLAMGAIGIGIAGAGIGLLAFATAMTLIAAEAPAFAAGLIATLSALLIGIVALKPEFVVAVITIVEGLCEAIIGSIDTILETLQYVLVRILEWLLETIVLFIETFEKHWPKIKEALVKIGTALLNLFKKYGPKIIDWLKETLGNIWQTVKEKAPEWLRKLGEWLLKMLSKLGQWGLDVLKWFWDWLKSLPAKALEAAGDLLDAGKELITNLWDGFVSKFEDAITEVKQFVADIKEAIIGKALELYESGKTAIGNFIDGIFGRKQEVYDAGTGTVDEYTRGINDKNEDAKTAGRKTAAEVLEGANEVDFEEPGKNAIKGFIRGFSDQKYLSQLKAKARELGNTAKNTLEHTLEVQSPSKVMERIGAFATEGFAKGLLSQSEYNDVILSANGLGGGAVQYTIAGLKSKWPDLFGEIDKVEEDITDDVNSFAKELAIKASQTFDENLDKEQEITIVVDTKDFDKKLERMSKELEKLQIARENELALGDAKNEERLSDIDDRIKSLETERKETNMDYMRSQGLNPGHINYELRDAVLTQKDTAEKVRVDTGIQHDWIREVAKAASDGAKSNPSNVTVNQNITAPNPVSPVDQYRAGQMALHGLNIHGINYELRDKYLPVYQSSTT